MMNYKEKADRHNYLLNCIQKWELENSSCKSSKEHEEILIKITHAVNEVETIRKELGINTCTVITDDDLNKIK